MSIRRIMITKLFRKRGAGLPLAVGFYLAAATLSACVGPDLEPPFSRGSAPDSDAEGPFTGTKGGASAPVVGFAGKGAAASAAGTSGGVQDAGGTPPSGVSSGGSLAAPSAGGPGAPGAAGAATYPVSSAGGSGGSAGNGTPSPANPDEPDAGPDGGPDGGP
ncbi:MAG: hypothetical protein RL701_4533 [Pseudomonadota bacterium]